MKRGTVDQDEQLESSCAFPPDTSGWYFDGEELWTQIQLVLPHFDEVFYLAEYPDVVEIGISPVEHYCTIGWREDRQPSPTFDGLTYIKNNPEIAALQISPLAHQAIATKGEPASEARRLQCELMLSRPHFDPAFYLASNPDVAEAGVDALEHFCVYGWREGRTPTRTFNTNAYLAKHPSLVALDLNPFVHFILNAKSKIQDDVTDMESDEAASSLDVVLEALSSAFDPAFYLYSNADVASSEMDPLQHFCLYGWKEGRDPSPGFSTEYYLANNPDVADSGINPFFHYVKHGIFEGRTGRHPGGAVVESLQRLVTLEEVVTNWRKGHKPQQDFIDLTELEARLSSAVSKGRTKLILSVSHDDYLSNVGGVQLCIDQEARRAEAFGALYLNIHPAYPLPRILHEDEDPDPVVIILLEGERLGACHISDLIAVLTALRSIFNKTHVVIHHLMGHLPRSIVDLVYALDSNECHLWLHDFFTICPSYTLLRNTISFCGAPPLESNACQLCRYGPERVAHQQAMGIFFKALSVHVLSPSETTARLWTEKSALLPASITVCPHMTLEWGPLAVPFADEQDPDRINVAFVGAPASHKGWAQFERLVKGMAVDERFKFFHFGLQPAPQKGLTHVSVQVSADSPDAMIRALQAESVDLVINWSICAETFSFSTHEALAAGAFVVTNPNSGNIAALVNATQQGAVLRDADDLLAAFTDGRAIELATQSRKLRRTQIPLVRLGDMTLPILARERITS